MTEYNAEQRARLAAELKDNEGYNLFVGEVLNAQVRVFMKPLATEEELRDAHSVVKSLSLLASHIDRQITEMKMQQKKEG